MTDVKCVRCGALTTGATQICQVCGSQLSSIGPYHAHQPRHNGVTIRPFNSVGDVLGPTINLFTGNFWLITKITVVIAAPFEIFRALNFGVLAHDMQLTAAIIVLEMLCTILIAPALIYSLMQVMQTGIAPGVNESYRWGFSKLGKLTVCAIISWILIGLGALLCVIPGVIVAVWLSLVFPIAILEKGSPLEVLQRSWELTNGHWWKILGATIVIFLLSLMISLPLKLVGEYLVASNPSFWLLHAAGGILAAIPAQATTILSLVTYLSIRALWSQSTQ